MNGFAPELVSQMMLKYSINVYQQTAREHLASPLLQLKGNRFGTLYHQK